MTHGSQRDQRASMTPSWGAPTSSIRSSRCSTSSTEAARARSSWWASRGSARRGCSRELAARAELRGHLVLSGSASELERDLPFSVFVHALDEYVESLDPDAARHARRRRASRARARLALAVRARRRPSGGAPARALSQPPRGARAARAARATRPLVLVLDDFHWADSASVELLGALLRRPPAAAVLIAVALRPRQTPERLAAALERAHRAAALTRIELGALTPDEARELLGERVDAAGAAVLYEESGGNPFYLEQLARSLERAG